VLWPVREPDFVIGAACCPLRDAERRHIIDIPSDHEVAIVRVRLARHPLIVTGSTWPYHVALNRDITEGPFDDHLQTDAAINHGNSGGPLPLNEKIVATG
jgi:hypothetical protein